MGEWWTYSLSDFLMFSSGTWYRLLELHNQAWFPLQPLFALPAAWLLWAVCAGPTAGRASSGWRSPRWGIPVLLNGLGWLWVAWAFHLERYAPINWAARYAGAAFAVQGLALVALGLAASRFHVSRAGLDGVTGMLMLAAALLYPLLVLVLSRPWPQSEWAGLMPDPTALAAMGLVLCLRRADGAPWRPGRALYLAVPAAWCAVSGATQWTMGSAGWFVLPAAAVLAVVLAGRRV